MYLKTVIILFLALTSLSTIGQYTYHTSRKNKDLVDLRQYKHGGWMFAPGLTYMLPNKIKAYNDSLDSQDNFVNDNLKRNGRVALYLEVGRYQIFYDGGYIFNYMDYSLAYKRLSGTEKYYDNKSVFKQNFLVANFNINNIIQLSDFKFIQNSIGVNLDWKFLQKYSPSDPASPLGDNTSSILFSLHYKFGFGFKVTDELFIIPSIETPILNGLEWEKGKSTYGIFTSRYRPLIFSVRFAFLRRPDKGACPPVYGPDGDREKQNQHMMGG